MTEEHLRSTISKLAHVDSGIITWTSSLSRLLGNSLGQARLDAALRSEYGIVNQSIYKVGTFGELCSVLGIDSSSETVAAAPESAAALPTIARGSETSFRVGVDVESVKAMPVVLDYWNDDFYKNTFTNQEIAYALLQTSTQASFAAMWCAKEALRKTDAELRQADWQRLEVVHDSNGKPNLMVDGLACGALSLSHTDEIAIAIFVAGPLPQQINSVYPLPPASTPLTGTSRRYAVISILALLISIATLSISFLRH